jgi:Sugar phosphate isomerases/epimerases
MYLAVFSPALQSMTLADALKYIKGLGVDHIELGAGCYPGTAHADAVKLASDGRALAEFNKTVADSGVKIAAVSVQANPLHPDLKIRENSRKYFEAACIFAEKIGADTVVAFSGCPGGAEGDKTPNWPVTPWPEDYLKILDYQWNEEIIPYWKTAAAFAKARGIKVALEMHPGFSVYNPATVLKLRAAAGDNIGANFDPSHLIWQGINPAEAIKYLKGAIYHFHAKDTKLNRREVEINGVLDTKHYTDEINRSFIFRTVGYGMSPNDWKDIFSALNLVGYDGAISIEHEDSLMEPFEGLEKAAAFLKHIIINAPKPEKITWA